MTTSISYKTSRDVNGNKTLIVSPNNGHRGFSIQTNGNLPRTHRDGVTDDTPAATGRASNNQHAREPSEHTENAMTEDTKQMLRTHYTRENFPHYVGTNGLWDIYRNDDNYCAAIPIDDSTGRLPSHYGDLRYVHQMALNGSVTLAPAEE